MSLEELLNRLSDGLVVRSADWTSTPSGNLACVYTYQEVPQEVREQFKNELRSHILENTKESTTYSFEHWKDRDAWIVRSTLEVNNRSGMFLGMIMLPQRPIKLGADENLKKVLDRLTPLNNPRWDEYGFRCETFFEITCNPETRQHQVSTQNLSHWLRKEQQE